MKKKVLSLVLAGAELVFLPNQQKHSGSPEQKEKWDGKRLRP